MPSLAEILKAANVKDEVIAGLPQEVTSAITGYVSQAETTLQTANQERSAAAEDRRIAGEDRKDIENYVNTYKNSLVKEGSTQAELTALKSYIESLKTQGFELPALPVAASSDGKSAVPGSPAIGANAVDVNKIVSQVRGEAGAVMAQFLDANNEHIRLYGVPIPDSSASIAREAAEARKTVSQFLSDKYHFPEKRKENETAAYNARVAADVKKQLDAEHAKEAEARASNPNLRFGEPSRNSTITPMKHEDFQNLGGNIPRRERLNRMLNSIHKEVAQIQQTA